MTRVPIARPIVGHPQPHRDTTLASVSCASIQWRCRCRSQSATVATHVLNRQLALFPNRTPSSIPSRLTVSHSSQRSSHHSPPRAAACAVPVLPGRGPRSEASARRSRLRRSSGRRSWKTGGAIPRGEFGLCDPRRSQATTGASVRLTSVAQAHPYSPRYRAKREYERGPFSRLAQRASDGQRRRCAEAAAAPAKSGESAQPRLTGHAGFGRSRLQMSY